MNNGVIPSSLKIEAYNLFRYEPSFRTFEEFKTRFRAEIRTIGYIADLKRELELCTQGPNETFTAYVRVLVDYYERIGAKITQIDNFNRILRKMHPDFRQALSSKRINTIREL